jgi:hypothetical protein
MFVSVLVFLPLFVRSVCAGLPMTVPQPAVLARRVIDRAGARRVSAPFILAARPWSHLVIANTTTPPSGTKEHPMITETQPCIIVLQLTDELITQLRPFMAGLAITATAHTVEHAAQCLTMRAEVYELLAERVGSALDYDVRWQPNEYEPDGFVERVRPLELTNGILVALGCPQCGVQLLANRAEITCTCGQVVALR